MKKTVIFLFLILCMTAVNTGCQKICDAIAAAGGLSEQAAGDSLNQAEVLSDGQMLRVLTTEEAAAATVQPGQETAESSRDGRVDINTADASALMSLPGIGQSKADAIIAYRNEHGAFKAPEELMNISGIKEGVYQKIKDSIKVN